MSPLGFDRMKLVLQAEAAECGLACLAMVANHHGHSESLGELRRRFPPSLAGSSLRGIMNIADVLGFTTRAVRCDLEELGQLAQPCILHWGMDHYVVLRRATARSCVILDPARGRRVLQLDEVSKYFTGVALELTPAPHFEKKPRAERVALSDLWSRLSGFYPVLAQLFLLTLLLQTFGLVMPLANQMVIDDVIGRGDANLLVAVIVGFGLFAVIQTAIELLRSFIQIFAGQRLAMQLTGNLIRHMLRLPTGYFERRHVGDILSRYGSLQPVQDFLTGGITGVLLDAILVIPATVIMVMYSAKLSALVAAGIVLTLLVELLAFHRNRRFTDETLTLGARTQSIFLEMVRAVRAIKLAGRETERHAVWQNAMAEQQNLSFRQSVFNLWGGSGFSLLMAIQNLLLLFIGAHEIMGGNMTLGMFVAFQSYAGQFTTRSKSLVGQFFAFRMLGLHLERLADIVHADSEPSLDGLVGAPRALEGAIEIRNLDFRYGPQDPWILSRVNLRIEPGERVALTGPSGGGKSTLLKLLTGLYAPNEGEVLVDGIPLTKLGMKCFRGQIGVVMQDDQLLSGTIADNVAFFDAQIDMERVEQCCRIARIHDEIVRLPMAYHSLVGDMGSVLSGGQKQRLLLARALYRKPRVLFMDEGTANLDPALEELILADLRGLGITQIMVAHRQAVIDFCEKAYMVAYCTVSEVNMAPASETAVMAAEPAAVTP
jgi:ATP-binding cassette subfamily B protein RaxB